MRSPSFSVSGIFPILKIVLTRSTKYGIISFLQFMICSLVNPKESAALLFFSLLIAFLTSSNDARLIFLIFQGTDRFNMNHVSADSVLILIVKGIKLFRR